MDARITLPVLALALGACILPPSDAGETLESSNTTDPSETDTTGASSTGEQSTGPGNSSAAGESTSDTDEGSGTAGEPGCDAGMKPGCDNQLDLLIVVDNSASMAEEQLRLARAMPLLVSQFENLATPEGLPIDVDVHVMVTTTDLGHPLCTPFQPPGYTPAQGAPIATSCTDRLGDFNGLDGMTSVPEACTAACPSGLAPTDAFLSFSSAGSNVPDEPDVDVDGDGVPDSDAARALACMVPQGINGCGYESPLEAMTQALNMEAPWNEGPNPFLRDGASLAIMLLTDEYDCSVIPENYGIFTEPPFQNTDPDTGAPSPTSAVCWNAGVECTGSGADHGTCTSANNGLHFTDRYDDYLRYLADLGGDVFMVQLVGVPVVTSHMPDPPFLPNGGGRETLVYRDWLDGVYPMGDILPDEDAQGITAADKEFTHGIGPGCTAPDESGQATPPVRMLEVCDGLGAGHCCVESVCDGDYSAATFCLRGMLTAP